VTKSNCVLLSATALGFLLASSAAAADIEVRVLSGRADMVTGGDALVETNAAPEKFSATLNGQDVTKSFRPAKTGTLVAHVEGLKIGKNALEVKSAKGSAKLELTNYPITGPVFSGPHQKPFVCQTRAPLDEDCSAKTIVIYLYKSTQPPAPGSPLGGFKVFEPSNPRPADIAQTTTSDGRTVDYIVRRELGTINRANYDIAMLDDPARPSDPWNAGSSWNGRLVYSFGGGCAAGYRQGTVTLVYNTDAQVAAGYAVARSSLNVFGNNCNDVISAETVMMVKEHFIKQFGVPVHTIGIGGSGGSLQQHLIAQNYPGLLDGITPSVSGPDVTTMIPPVVDCSLLAHAFDTGTGAWTDEQKKAVSGFATWGTCAAASTTRSQSWIGSSLSPAWVVAKSCDPIVPKSMVYDAQTNPTGVRCDLYDNQVNVFGRDPKTGFARRTLDNVGVQYGLVALNSGKISAEQFLDLNQRIGGYDQDGNIVADRSKADPVALRTAYETGRVNSGGGSLGSIPIIDYRPYIDPTGDVHQSVGSFTTRARLMAANGRADNQVILRMAPVPLDVTGGDVLEGAFPVDRIRMMDSWLDRIAKDHSKDSPAVKVARNKPPEVADACWTATGEKIVEPASYTGGGRCNQMYPPNGDPRIAAGGPLADNILKCTLKPVDPKDYIQPLTREQLARLKMVFPEGVCDYTRPGVGQQHFDSVWHRF
jgi:hypothetical protein